ncbi:RHS repeat-associated core domain-containing protein [Chryseobacterium kwangjuense]|uniref:RHS repeat-associated core domain-containing protein n=1 Tax=Chryseobacterium kwangjuense TaxID=267125 RepID=A0ABW9K9J6_9FLAO
MRRVINYPFGLKHEGYNVLGGNPAYKYKYQGQELQETGFYSFKWRNYIPDLGRFFNIDPLAEKFPYNTPYAFQENKLGMGREFEGLELVPFEFLMMSNSSVRPTTPIAEAMIKETPIEGITLNGRATPPPSPPGFWERAGNWISNKWDSLFGGNKPEPAQTMDKVTESVKVESVIEQVKPESAIDQILEGAQAGRETKGKTTQYEKEGGFQQTEKDFESLNPQNVKDIKTDYGIGRTGKLENGQQATSRPGSTDGRPTLEIRNPQNKRYRNKI